MYKWCKLRCYYSHEFISLTHTHTHTYIYIYIYMHTYISVVFYQCICAEIEVDIYKAWLSVAQDHHFRMIGDISGYCIYKCFTH